MTDIDPEIAAFAAVSKALQGLEPDVQARVVRWAAEKFGVTLAQTDRQPSGRSSTGSDSGGDAGGASANSFDDFVDLFDAVNPKNDVEKVLTGAYWIQVCKSEASWLSGPVNNQLKDTGHGVANVTDVLRRAQERKPALVRQMSKSGRSQQARKTYKLTTKGIEFINLRLQGETSADDNG